MKDNAYISNYNRKYYAEHREEISLRRANNRNQEKGITLDMPAWEQVKEAQGKKCVRCSKVLTLIPFLVDEGTSEHPQYRYIGLCKPCGSREAQEMAVAFHRRRMEARLEADASVFD